MNRLNFNGLIFLLFSTGILRLNLADHISDTGDIWVCNQTLLYFPAVSSVAGELHRSHLVSCEPNMVLRHQPLRATDREQACYGQSERECQDNAHDHDADALEILGKEDIQLVILDIMMPVMNGIEVAEKIRESSTL